MPSPEIYTHPAPTRRDPCPADSLLSSAKSKRSFTALRISVSHPASRHLYITTSTNHHTSAFFHFSNTYLVPKFLEKSLAHMMLWNLDEDFFGYWKGKYVIWYVPDCGHMYMMRLEPGFKVGDVAEYGSMSQVVARDFWFSPEMTVIRDAVLRTMEG